MIFIWLCSCKAKEVNRLVMTMLHKEGTRDILKPTVDKNKIKAQHLVKSNLVFSKYD
jgi:hypothetical protein